MYASDARLLVTEVTKMTLTLTQGHWE